MFLHPYPLSLLTSLMLWAILKHPPWMSLKNPIRRNKKAAIIISEHDVIPSDFKITKLRALQRISGLWLKPLGTAWTGAVTENRKSDLGQLRGVAMGSPDDDSSQTAGTGLQHGQVTDASFIGAIVIVNYQHIARSSRSHCLEENVDTAKMPNWQCASG